MRLLFSLFLTAGVLAGSITARAQQAQPAPANTPATITIYTKDGRSIATTGVRLAGTALMTKVKLDNGTEGEAGYDLSNIARVEFPDPAQLKIASDLLVQGRADEAYKQLAPALAYYSPFRDLPGSWWTALALTQLDALGHLGRDGEADALAAELAKLPAAPPEVQRAVKIRQGIGLERSGKHLEALAVLEPIARDEAVPPQSLPDAWLSMGAADLALGRNKPALLAYLHVPVYVPERTLSMAPALLGSAIAYGRLNDNPRAKDTLEQLIAAYPNSHEAAEAKDRLRALNNLKAKAKQNS